MSEQSFFRKVAVIVSLAVVACVLAGCAQVAVDPGPNPARVTMELTALVSKARIKEVMSENALDNPAVLPGWFHRVEGPFWQWGLYVEAKDGTLDRVPNDRGLGLVQIRADNLRQKLTFSAPPNASHLVLLVEPYLVHYFYERGLGYARESSESYSIAVYREDLRLKLCPGCHLTLKRVIKDQDWPKEKPAGQDGRIQ